METNDCSSDVQADIYRLALSIDSLFVNGIQFGVIQAASCNGVVERLSETLLKDLDVLRLNLPCAPAHEKQKASEALDDMRSEVIALTDLLVRLSSFRSFSLTELLTMVAHVGAHRDECVRLVGDLEKCLRTLNPFYATRPTQAAAAVNAFLADLPQVFEMEWNAARSKASAQSA